MGGGSQCHLSHLVVVVGEDHGPGVLGLPPEGVVVREAGGLKARLIKNIMVRTMPVDDGSG